MDKYIDSVKLALLIANYFKGELTVDEQLQLSQWLAEDPAHAVWLEELKNEKVIAGKVVEYDRFHSEKSWKKVRHGIRGRKIWLYRLSAVAAMLLLLLGSIYWFASINPVVPEQSEVIVAGGHKARLVLEDGTVVSLDTLVALDLKEVHVAQKENFGLVYAKNIVGQEGMETPVYHQLCVPRGGEYDLLLEDGTRVWLNADSKLKYPVAFVGKERKVFLEGEAYFAVAKDVERPFRVQTRGQEIEVLGTEFNVSAYEEEENVYTTLVEGKVKVSTSDKEEVVLLPGEQTVLEVQTGQIEKRNVYVEEFIGWKSGNFVFEDQNLEQIMRTLSRWYDFQFVCRNESLKKVVFQGSVTRYGDFEKVLKLLERTGEMKFRVQGKTVTVDE